MVASLSPILVKIADFGISKRWGGTFLRTNCGTLSYQAPEQIGLLPRAAGNSYSERVDIWALGAIVHQVLTSEIPFLDANHEGEDSTDFLSDLDLELTNTTSGLSGAMVDMGLLLDYCRNLKPFPTGSLEKNGVSSDGIGFVMSVMIANPADRVCAAEALKSTWLSGIGSPALAAPKQLLAAPRPTAGPPRPSLDPPRPLFAPLSPSLAAPRPSSPERVQRLIHTELLAPAWQAPAGPAPRSPAPKRLIRKALPERLVPARKAPRLPAPTASPLRLPPPGNSPRRSLNPARRASVLPASPPLVSTRSVILSCPLYNFICRETH